MNEIREIRERFLTHIHSTWACVDSQPTQKVIDSCDKSDRDSRIHA